MSKIQALIVIRCKIRMEMHLLQLNMLIKTMIGMFSASIVKVWICLSNMILRF